MKYEIKGDASLFLQAKEGLRDGTKLRSLLKGIVQNDIEATPEQFAKWKQDVAVAIEEYQLELQQEVVWARLLFVQICEHVVKGRVD